jgi:histidyl-tRNA synthetase
MGERGMFPEQIAASPADVMVTIWNADAVPDALALAAELRAAGLRVEVYPEPDKLGKQFKYAASRNIPCVAIVGDEERAQGLVAVKHLPTASQQAHRRDGVAQILRTLTARTHHG